eukprot:CAMPEP_0114599424 /NCGR_PEP_ID=MMETSP0125-20121206/21962_1 /TAXON_ID=485358 ORGANISM="Aristerostoma sp., Strain ATCC 50986" /NCGR_SAMPLE_ID=MMETSP0125 /ASSEMBLY_ACC=CAM_ASM_000245 /LENGTH=54 /DNA_ID=CAMNT_0001806477 /DNA_START=194 /DNA_END=359 /DNA_ORIENTATION=+
MSPDLLIQYTGLKNAFMDLFRKEFVFPGIARHRPPKEAEGDDEEGDGDGDGDDE